MPDISLDAAGAHLVGKLGGSWRSGGGMCLCPAHDDHSPSLSVRVGHSSLLFKCFAGCSRTEVMRAIRRLALDVPVREEIPFRQGYRPDNAFGEVARSLFDEARYLNGTPGEVYLRSRHIGLLPPMVRWHPRVPLGRGRDVRFRPALLAAVQDQRSMVAVQRLFLEPDGRALASDMLRPKRTLGRPLAGAVRLGGGGARLGLAEGVESALSASILLGLPVWAALGGERLHQIAIPPAVETLLLLPDNDPAGRRAERRAREAYVGRIPTVETQWPWWGLNDWNDVLRRRKGGGGPERSAA